MLFRTRIKRKVTSIFLVIGVVHFLLVISYSKIQLFLLCQGLPLAYYTVNDLSLLHAWILMPEFHVLFAAECSINSRQLLFLVSLFYPPYWRFFFFFIGRVLYRLLFNQCWLKTHVYLMFQIFNWFIFSPKFIFLR